MITYCTNIHPGESWEDTFAALREHIPLVKRAVSPDRSFPVGLRLSSQAAEELTDRKNKTFTAWLDEQDCFIPAINGFPFGWFHGERIKDLVYLPDWRSSERANYTIRLAELLAGWLPAGVTGSISTVPVGFKGALEKGDLFLVRKNLLAVLTRLEDIRQKTGRTVVLALEPEPGCWLETTKDVCDFFAWLRLPGSSSDLLGVCYDCCHQAVQFENPAESLARLKESGIPVARVQISSALAADDADVEQLIPLAEPCYLHQVVIRRRDGTLFRYVDLPQALEGHDREAGDEWRCHFHVPVFLETSAGLRTTRPFLEECIPLLPEGMLLEVETYTWDVLPPALRCGSVDESIIRELCWLKEQFNAAHRRP